MADDPLFRQAAQTYTFDFTNGKVTQGANSGGVIYNTGTGTGAMYPQAGQVSSGVATWQHLTGMDASGLALPDMRPACEDFRDMGRGYCKCGRPYDEHPDATLELLLQMKEKLK